MIATADSVRKVIRDDRSLKGLELSKINLDGPLRADEPISGRALLINHTGSTIWMERAGNSHGAAFALASAARHQLTIAQRKLQLVQFARQLHHAAAAGLFLDPAQVGVDGIDAGAMHLRVA